MNFFERCKRDHERVERLLKESSKRILESYKIAGKDKEYAKYIESKRNK